MRQPGRYFVFVFCCVLFLGFSLDATAGRMETEFHNNFQKMVGTFKSAGETLRAVQKRNKNVMDKFSRKISGNVFKQEPISHSVSRPPPSRRLIRPINGRITSYFGSRYGRKHDGIDIAARSGQPILSAADGTVVFSGWRSGYGRTIVIQHNRRLKTVYAHNSRNLVRKGEKVRQGQVIALVGSSGRSTGPHLHFEVRNGSGPQNPLNYI